MRISHSQKFVFLAYPRTASSTIRSLLDEASDIKAVHISETTPDFPFNHHMNARELKRSFDNFGWSWADYRHFCVVRNPYDRLVSLFKRRIERENRWDARLKPQNNLASFLLRVLPKRQAFSFFIVTRNPERGVASSLQTFTGDTNGGPLVEDILRFEYLAEELPPYLDSLGIQTLPEKMPRVNASANQASYQSYYHSSTRERVKQLYAYEIERFNYQFDPD